MNIHDDFDISINTILGWIKSCQLQTQLVMCKNAVELVQRQYSKTIHYMELELGIYMLLQAIESQALIIASISEADREKLMYQYRETFHSQTDMV